MSIFRKRSKKDSQREAVRNSNSSVGQQRVISYYTASRRQLDNFERHSSRNDSSLAYSRFERFRSSWFLVICVIASGIVLLYIASLSTTPSLKVTGEHYRTTTVYQERVSTAFGGDIRNRIKLLLQSSSLQESIQKAIPEATSVTVSSSLLGHHPSVKIITDTPVAIFSQPGNVDILISNRGRLMLPAADATEYKVADLPIIQNQTGVIGEAGEQFMRPDEAKAFSDLHKQYTAEHSKPLYTLAATPHELYAQEAGRGGYVGKYLLVDSIIIQFGALRATENKLKELAQNPSEYIDVRLADKAFYK